MLQDRKHWGQWGNNNDKFIHRKLIIKHLSIHSFSSEDMSRDYFLSPCLNGYQKVRDLRKASLWSSGNTVRMVGRGGWWDVSVVEGAWVPVEEVEDELDEVIYDGVGIDS